MAAASTPSPAQAQATDIRLQPCRACSPLRPFRQKLASMIWEGGSDVSPGGAFDGESPAGPPLWEGAPAPNLGGPLHPSSPMPQPLPAGAPPARPSEPVVSENGSVQLPSIEKIAGELGYKPAEFRRFVDDFASTIAAGPRSPAFRRLCARDEDSCRLLADFHAQAADAKRERRRSRKRLKNFRISEDNVSQAQRFEFQVLANSLRIDSLPRLQALAERSLKETECPRNLSAALAIKAEEHFPAPEARRAMRDLFEHSRACLSVGDELYERLYLRAALYSIYENDRPRARELLTEAMRSTSSTERYRVLYWLGWLSFTGEEGKGRANPHWTELMHRFPLSFYAIDAAAALGMDPLDMITQRRVGGLRREAPNDPELNRMIRWLEALYSFKHGNTVAKWASWIVRANEGELDVDVLLYLSSLKIATGLYRSNIQMLFGYFRKNPAALNSEALKLLYPRPYFDLVQEASRGRIDPFLVMGLVRQESGFDARAISHAKAKGLMQIIPGTARRLASGGHRKLLNERENTKMGVKYLLQLAGDFGNSVELVLAAYNAGPHRVFEWQKRNPDWKGNQLLWNDLIPYLETRDYTVSILRNNYIYLRLYGANGFDAPGIVASERVRSLLDRVPASRGK